MFFSKIKYITFMLIADATDSANDINGAKVESKVALLFLIILLSFKLHIFLILKSPLHINIL